MDFYTVTDVIDGESYSYGYGPWGCIRGDVKRVEIGEGITSIGKGAFASFEAMSEVVLPSTLESIGFLAFCRCTSLSFIEIPLNVKRIESHAFSACSILSEVGLSNGLQYVGECAFQECERLVSIKIPSSVEIIDASAFEGCTALSSIEITSGVQAIGNSAFEGCTALTSIEIPSSVQTIGNSAFEGCTALTTIEIPSSVQTIGEAVLSGCTALRTITGDAVIEMDTIPARMFENCSKLIDIELSDHIKYIDDEAFSGCLWLDELFGDMTYIGSGAFRNCSNLKKVISTDTVSVQTSAFEGCERLTKVPVLKSIGDYSFYGCKRLETIIMDEVFSMGYLAFAECERLDTIYLTVSRGIEEWLSSYSPNIYEYRLSERPNYYEYEKPRWYESSPQYWADAFYVNGDLIDTLEITLDRHDYVRPAVLYGYKGLKKLILDMNDLEGNSSLNFEIGKNAFGSDSLVDLELYTSTMGWIHEENFKGVKHVLLGGEMEYVNGLFQDCSTLETINIPPSVETIGDEAFKGCYSLQSVDISEESILRTIGNNAFAGDGALVSIGHLPYTLEELGDGAFQSCAKLRGDIVIPDGVSRIGENTFDGCLMLTGMSLPAAITEIGDEAFKNCVNLKEMSVYTLDPPTVGRDAFENLNCTLKVPCMGAAIYKIADGWDYFEDNIVEISPYRLIVVSNNDVYGSVQVTTPATCESDIVTVSAVPAPQCHFVCWRNRAGDNLSESNPYVFTITSDLTLIAEFRSDADTAVLYTVDYEPNPAGGRISVECEGETVNPGDRLESGSILELRAIANEGYEFVKWWDGETKASRDYYLDENLEISATFRKDSQDTTGGLCVVEFNPEPAGGRIMVECEGEKVNPGDRLAAGSFLELRAIADEGYRFVEWWDGETKARRDYELEEDVEISALFQKETAVESMQSEFCRIWPNPTEGRFYVELETAADMEVLSANGMIVRPLVELPAGRHEIDLDGQASGVYFLRLISAQENRVFKILLQR